MAAGGADEAVGPAPGGEMPGTGGFIGKARLEGGAGHGAVIVPAAGHDGTLHEQAADAHQKLNISSNRAQSDKPLLDIRHGLHRKIKLYADASVHLRAAGERYLDGLVGDQRQAAAGAVPNYAELVQQLVAQVVRLIDHEERAAVAEAVDNHALRLKRRTDRQQLITTPSRTLQVIIDYRTSGSVATSLMKWTPPADGIAMCQGGVEVQPPEAGEWDGRLPPLMSALERVAVDPRGPTASMCQWGKCCLPRQSGGSELKTIRTVVGVDTAKRVFQLH